MSLLATSYRYEKMSANPGLVRALSAQAERVQVGLTVIYTCILLYTIT